MASSSELPPKDDHLPSSPTTPPIVDCTHAHGACCGDTSVETEIGITAQPARTAPEPHAPHEHARHTTCTHCPHSCGDARTHINSPSSEEEESCHHENKAMGLQAKVREIMRSDATSDEKAVRINEIFAESREAALKKPSAVKPGQFSGLGAPSKCAHYERKCWIKAECCQKYYACPRCHDEHEAHDIDIKSIKLVGCIICGEHDQPLAPNCRACGAKFARYFCEPCRMYNDASDKDCYHCDDCGICRLGKGLGIDNFHCHKCNSCWPLDAMGSHPCRPGNLDNNCPICQKHMATTTEGVYVLDCAHAIHTECFDAYVRAGNFACPLCSKSLMDKEVMNDWHRKIDERLVLDEIPEEFKRKRSKVFCNDCETKSIAPFHFRFHKCQDCGGYNTTVLHQFDQDEEEEEERTLDERHPPPPPAAPPPPADHDHAGGCTGSTSVDGDEIDQCVDET